MPEGGGRDGAFVLQGLGAGEPGVVVDCGVEVDVADSAGVAPGPFGGAGFVGADPVHPPTAAGGDASEFLDVDVDRVAGALVFVADDVPQPLAGRRVEVT
ncbi:hypothetical protein ACFXBB_16920 [Streptomyces scopuliridis]|uniref:hypothetical protein n=1 Tax=Streptomyces scopuliridis TaxID=452529 RepID=UPI003689C37A